jgi:hypothetical protein
MLEPSADVPMDVFHTVVAVVAHRHVVVISKQPYQSVGAVLGRGKDPEGGTACSGVAQEAVLAGRSATSAAIALARMDRSSCMRDAMRRVSSAW